MEAKIIAYTTREKLLLASLIDQHKIVENKKTDAATIQAKKNEWDRIAEEYNSQAQIISTRRNSSQLKKLWNNLKQKKRKETSQMKYSMLLTGGGPPPKKDEDPVMEAVATSAPHMDVELDCPWDSTSQFEKNKVILGSQENITTTSTSCVDFDDDSHSPDMPIILATSLSGATNNEAKTFEPIDVSQDKYTLRMTSNTTPRKPIIDTAGTKSRREKSGTRRFDTECNLRVRKMREAIEQQAELHQIKMKIEEEQLNIANTILQKKRAEAELAYLKLQVFKEQNNLN